jgi:hypothetical protein
MSEERENTHAGRRLQQLNSYIYVFALWPRVVVSRLLISNRERIGKWTDFGYPWDCARDAFPFILFVLDRGSIGWLFGRNHF